MLRSVPKVGRWSFKKRFLGYAGGDDGTGNASFLFRRRRRNSPKNPEVKGCEGWRFAIANTTPSLDFWIAWYALRGRRPTCSRGRPPRRSLRSIKKPALPSVKLTRRADSHIMALVVGMPIPDHEYMRDKLTYSPQDNYSRNWAYCQGNEIVPSEEIGGFFMAKNIKKRNWAFVLYPESAPADWREQLQKLDYNVQSVHCTTKT